MKNSILLCIFLLLIACGDKDDGAHATDKQTTSDSYLESDEMIHLTKGSVKIGSNDKSFRANEKPAMKVLLNYDFYIGKHEVTCGEYADIAKKAKLKTFGKCKNDSLPITDITYYDAVLFANALSKQKEYDTAYTYSKAVFDTEGHCTFLEGFAFKPGKDSYRLPTEAEWIYAATKDWNIKKSWNNGNSDYTSHKICTKGTDSTGLCDMAGNVMEWVNDWLGTFRDTTVENYIGAPSKNDKGERIVKGGYYGLSTKEINPYSRGDVYTVTSSTKADYVGFRLAFGHIPDAQWMNDEGESSTSVITTLASPETVKSITGTYNVKLVFRNDINGNLAYLDYKNGSQSVKEITKGINAYHPEISPNGNWVAYCTAYEGQAKKSTLYVQNLEDDSASPIKLKNENAAIPRWRVLDNGDTVIVYVSDAGINKDNSTFKETSTWEVPFANGKFGTPQKLFDGAYHGGISEDNTLAVTGARLLRARIAKSGSTITKKAIDTVWYNNEQACNVSLVQDNSKRTSFLDFGGKTGRKFANENYSTHQRILIADSTGKLIQTIKAPSGYTFDHSEWATNGKTSNLVATLANVNGAHTKIVLVNPTDSSVTELVESEELWHPTLWIMKKESIPDTDFQLDPDSAGLYYVSGGNWRHINYRYKLELLWKYRDSINVVFMGSSRVLYSLNPDFMEKPYFAINLANSGNTLPGAFFLFKHYVLPHLKNLKYVVVGTDLDRLLYLDSFFNTEAFTIPGYAYDRSHNYWVDGFPKELVTLTENGPVGSATLKETLLTHNGFYPESCNGWRKSNPELKQDSNWHKNKPEPFDQNLETLKEFPRLAQKLNVRVIGIEIPFNTAYQKTGAYGNNGILRSEAPALIQQIQDISDIYPNFIFMNENNFGNHDYTSEMAHDDGHLCPVGAEQLTKRVLALIKKLDAESKP